MRLKQILDAVQTNLTGLTTTGTNAYQNRVYPIQNLPAINVRYGAQQMNTIAPNVIDNTVEIIVDAYCKAQENQLDDTLIKIQSEVHAAMMADYTQGLNFVIDTTPIGASAPDVSDESETPTAVKTISFQITFRHSETSLEA